MNDVKDCHINVFYDFILFAIWSIDRYKCFAKHNVLHFWRYFYDLYANKVRAARRAKHIEKMEGLVMDAVKFLKNAKRMCDHYPGCSGCPVSESDVLCNITTDEPEMLIDIVEKWAELHPEKTRMKDFFEKHPKAQRNQYGRPSACAKVIGYCDVCQRNEYGTAECERCWNMPVEE